VRKALGELVVQLLLSEKLLMMEGPVVATQEAKERVAAYDYDT